MWSYVFKRCVGEAKSGVKMSGKRKELQACGEQHTSTGQEIKSSGTRISMCSLFPIIRLKAVYHWLPYRRDDVPAAQI